MKIYHLTILGYYTNSDTTHQVSVTCDYMTWDDAGCYILYVRDGSKAPKFVACYPIKFTIVTDVEDVE